MDTSAGDRVMTNQDSTQPQCGIDKEANVGDVNLLQISCKEFEAFIQQAEKLEWRKRAFLLNEEQFTEFLNQCSSNESPETKYRLARVYQTGIGQACYYESSQSKQWSMYWYEYAAKQGHVKAQFFYAYNFKPCSKEFFKWLFLSAFSGGYGPALLALAELADYGNLPNLRNKDREYWLAYEIKLLQKAYLAGEKVAMQRLANLYLQELRVKQPLVEFDENAEMCLRHEALNGSLEANYCLGRMLLQHAQNDETTFARALVWLERAVKQGYASAQIEIAEMYANGYGCEQNLQQAIELYIAGLNGLEQELLKLEENFFENDWPYLSQKTSTNPNDGMCYWDSYFERVEWELNRYQGACEYLKQQNDEHYQYFKQRLERLMLALL